MIKTEVKLVVYNDIQFAKLQVLLISNGILGKRLVRTFFTSKEYPKQVSKKLTNINQFKDKEIIQLFKTIKKD